MDDANVSRNGSEEQSDAVRWPGAVMIIYGSVCICAYALCMYTIVHNKEMWKLPSFQIVLHIGIVDIVQLSLNGVVGGVFSLCQTDFDFVFNKIAGGLMNSGWITYTMMADLLAWNRCLHTYQPSAAKRIFNTRNTRLMLAACWVYGSAWVITYMCPDLSMLYTPSEHYWDYDLTKEPSRKFATSELVQDTLHCVSMVLCYSAIFFKLAKQARQITNSQLNTDKKEKLVLLQSMWICATTISVVVWFFFNTAIIPSHWAYFFTTMVWLTCAGSNAFIYLIFNKNIRRLVKELLYCGKNDVKPINVTSTRRQTTIVNKDTRT